MHFECLVEDTSGTIALKAFLSNILGQNGDAGHTYTIHSYKGVGHIPSGLKAVSDPRKRILLNQLPKLLKGYGKTFSGYGPDTPCVVVVVCDLDRKDCDSFRQELLNVQKGCSPAPVTLFLFAIEEGEAWLLGDRNAVERAYPNAKTQSLEDYVQDSICGTWEVLADAVYPGGAEKLKREGYPTVGEVKCEWARTISPLVDVEANRSPSFQEFRDAIRRAAGIPVAAGS